MVNQKLVEESFFLSPTKGKLSPREVILEVGKFLKNNPDSYYKLVIGTDSKVRKINGTHEVDFVSAIVIHRKGFGGRYFWQKIKKQKIATLRDKIYTETFLSLDLAQKFVPQLQNSLNGHANYELEIHIDVGEAGDTRNMIKEVVGIITGNGFTAKTKPESYGAYVVADKHT